MAAVYSITAGAIGMAFAWPFIFATWTYLELPAGLMIGFGWRLNLVSITALCVGVYVFGRSLWRSLTVWNGGDRSGALQLLELVRVAPRRIALRSSFVVTSIVVTYWSVVFPRIGVPRLAAFGVVLASVIGIQVIALICAVSFDLLMRPIREEIAAAAPSSHTVGENRWSIEIRLFASATGMGFVIGALSPTSVLLFDTSLGAREMAVVIGAVVLATIGGTLFWALGIRPVLRPIADLTQGTQRVAAGEFNEALAVTSDDELGHLVASFNRMQKGLLERERLHTAFGSYVEPGLAERLLAQGDDLFAGEEAEVTVFFVDVRDFTAWSERSSAHAAVSRLNELFELVVPVLREHKGHANKFSGDGVLAVFGVPEQTSDHADRAVTAAVEIQRRVRECFGEVLRIGIGINSGRVIAGTVGGGGKLEFTLIGDPVNVAARVEQLTKDTGDPILLTQATHDALTDRPRGLVPRGSHVVRGKSEPVVVHGLDPFTVR